MLEAHARLLLEQRPSPDDLLSRVRVAIDAELRGGQPKLERVAKRLAMSARTLQRRLSEKGVQFNLSLIHI